MRILIWRHGQRVGPHTIPEINSLLEKGALALDDLAESPDTGNWVPLASIDGVAPEAPALSFDTSHHGGDIAHGSVLTAAATAVRPPVSLFAQRTTFGSLSEVISNGVDQFLGRTSRHIRPDGSISSLTHENFFEKWLAEADKFTHSLCHDLAEILKRSSARDDIRAYDVNALSTRIREASCAELDGVLSSFVRVLKELGVSLAHTLETLQAASASEGAIQDWLAKEIDVGKSAAAQAARELPAARPATKKKIALLHRLHDLQIRSQSLAFSKMVDYVKALERLPPQVLAYCGERCFSADVDLELQAGAGASTSDDIEQRTTPVIERILNAASAEAQALEKRRRKELAKLRAEEDLYTLKTHYQFQGLALMSISGICLFPAWIIVLMGSPGNFLRWLALVGGIVGLTVFAAALTRLSMGRSLTVEHFMDAERIETKPGAESPVATEGQKPNSVH